MEEITGNWKKHFDYRFIAAEDFETSVKLTIKAAGIDEAFNGKSKDKVVVLSFEQTDKMMVLNKTNAKAISKLAGTTLVEKWKGLAITLTKARVSAFGQTVDAIRVYIPISSNQS